MKKIVYLNFFIFSSNLFSQDIDFSNTTITAPIINPSLTGNFDNGVVRLSTVYRIKRSTFLNNFKTIYVFTDGNIWKSKSEASSTIGLGISILSDKNTEGILNRNYISLSNSYKINLDVNGHHQLRSGIAASLAEVRLNPKRLIFENPNEVVRQYGFVNAIDQSSIFGSTAVRYLDFSLGLYYSYKSQDSRLSEFSCGLGAQHVNSPALQLSSISFELNMRFNGSLLLTCSLSDDMELILEAQYFRQKNMRDIFLSRISSKKRISILNKEYSLMSGIGFKKDYLNNSFVTGTISITLDKMLLLIIYDFNSFSKKNAQINNCTEIGIQYNF